MFPTLRSKTVKQVVLETEAWKVARLDVTMTTKWKHSFLMAKFRRARPVTFQNRLTTSAIQIAKTVWEAQNHAPDSKTRVDK